MAPDTPTTTQTGDEPVEYKLAAWEIALMVIFGGGCLVVYGAGIYKIVEVLW
jgi:hypothetical protein